MKKERMQVYIAPELLTQYRIQAVYSRKTLGELVEVALKEYSEKFEEVNACFQN